MNRYKLLTVTHKEVPLTELGKYFVTRKGNPDQPDREEDVRIARLKELKKNFNLEELFYLETCNRVVYLFYTSEEDEKSWDEGRCCAFFQFVNPLLTEDQLYNVAGNCRSCEGTDAIQHLLEIAASLDSLVIGEREILRQLKNSWISCSEAGLTGDHLRIAFQYAVPAAKKVYTETQIGEKPISVVSLAARRIRDTQISRDSRFLMIGAGQTNNLMAKFLRQYGFTNIDVFNRTRSKAEELGEGFDGITGTLEELNLYNRPFDVIITCTGASEPVLTYDLYSGSLSSLHNNNIAMVVDLAVPSDVDEKIRESCSVNYTGIEQLREAAEKNLSFRRTELTKASLIVQELTDQYTLIWKQRQLEKAMNSIPVQVKALRERAVAEVFSAEIDALDTDARATLDLVLDYFEKKYVSIPMSAARNVLAKSP